MLKLCLRSLNDLKSLCKLIVPKYLFQSVQENVLQIELHGFLGSSMKTHCIFVNLLCGKAKVAPLKNITIPCLELLSCVLLAKLLKNAKNTLNKSFEITSIFYWSDSEICLCPTQSIEKEWRQWAENRVNFIRKLTD